MTTPSPTEADLREARAVDERFRQSGLGCLPAETITDIARALARQREEIAKRVALYRPGDPITKALVAAIRGVPPMTDAPYTDALIAAWVARALSAPSAPTTEAIQARARGLREKLRDQSAGEFVFSDAGADQILSTALTTAAAEADKAATERAAKIAENSFFVATGHPYDCGKSDQAVKIAAAIRSGGQHG